MEDTHVHALDYLSVIRRRRAWLAVPIALSVVLGLALVKWLPKEYKSAATLGVAAPIVSPNIVNQSTIDNEERIRAVSQQLVSSSLIARVAREERLKLSGEALLTYMRKAISITVPEPVATTSEPRRLDTFIIAYSDTDPGRAQRVANRLVYDFVDENSKFRAARAEDTSEFLSAQLKATGARLADLEEKLRRAKESHMGQLPEQAQANLQTLSGLRQQIGANATALRSEQDRLSMIEHQIEGVRQGSGDAVVLPRAGGGDVMQTPETRVASLQRELAAARATYTDKHPEVIRLQEELAQARRDAAADRARPTSERNAQLQLDPAYRQLVADREMGRLRVRELERTDTDLKRQIAAYQARVEQAPMVEQQLASLQRDFDLEKQQYADLSAKLHSSTIAESLERNRRGEQFTVLYPAAFPLEPTKPVPWRVMLMSIVGGIAVGAALMLLREYLDRAVYSARDLHDEFEFPVLGTVAHIEAA